MDSKKLHPTVWINYLPRNFAAIFMLLICGLKLGWTLLEPQYLWLFILGIFYPHLLFAMAKYSANGKQQERLNMHFDAFITGIVVSIVPDYFFLSTATIVLAANALYIGAFRLLLTTMMVYATSLIISMFYLWPFNGFIDTTWTVKIINTVFVLIHFCTFAILSYYLTRRMIALNKEVMALSTTDPLTNAYNRRFLDTNLTKEIHRSERLNYPLTVIFADLDHFKTVNDNYGHQAGDKVLTQFVDIARDFIRQDIDWIARFGGEEFLLVLPYTDAKHGAQIAERIRNKLNHSKFQVAEHELTVSCSFGVASSNGDTQKSSLNALLSAADSGLYRAKNKGRNRVEIVGSEEQFA